MPEVVAREIKRMLRRGDTMKRARERFGISYPPVRALMDEVEAERSGSAPQAAPPNGAMPDWAVSVEP
ncbi:MAG: hypothetical protein AB7P35_17580 [Hyphomonadaceae bacterium]